jgi:hypothetical protein
MRVALGTFARSGIESQLGSDVVGAVQAALYHYTGKLEAGRSPIELPQIFKPDPKDRKTAYELAVDPEIETLLEREAERQGADVDDLAAHSVLIYLAELDLIAATPTSRPV